jgi:O-methyltransferase involved in polyketide biosynthesis
LAIAEGLVPYLTEADARLLLHRAAYRQSAGIYRE